MLRLTLLEGPDKGLVMETDKAFVSLGRGALNQLVLTGRSISRYHGQILWDGKRHLYRDLHSSNGSAIHREGKLLAVGPAQNFEVDLQAGDCLLLGDLERPTVVSIDWSAPREPEQTEGFPEDLTVEVEERTEMSSWKTLESATCSDGKMVTGLYRLTTTLARLSEGEEPLSLFGVLAQTLFETFPAATHVMVAELASQEEEEASETTLRFFARRTYDEHSFLFPEGAGPFACSLVRRALADRSGFLFSAASGDLARAENPPEARILCGLIVPYQTDKGEWILEVENRSGGEGFTRRDLEVLTVYSVYVGQIQNLHGRLCALSEQRENPEDENVLVKFRIFSRPGKPEEMVGASMAMHRLFGLLERIADLPTTVLISGETGTGKELVAKALHYNSKRRKGPFIAVNCSALSEALLDAQLFGHRKGAFTGAHEDRRGFFETADGGTLFLDELSQMALPTQARLLRVLEDGVFRRLGEERERRTSVRVIGATNNDLEQEVLSGRFRQDLYYRLNKFVLSIPPLRERREDIPVLCAHLIERISERLGIRCGTLTEAALEALRRYDFPGNVRELESMIVQAGRGPLHVELFPAYLRPFAAPQRPCDSLGAGPGTYKELKWRKQTLCLDLERKFVAHWLEKHKGVVKAAAAAAGMNRSQFHQLILRTGLDPSKFR